MTRGRGRDEGRQASEASALSRGRHPSSQSVSWRGDAGGARSRACAGRARSPAPRPCRGPRAGCPRLDLPGRNGCSGVRVRSGLAHAHGDPPAELHEAARPVGGIGQIKRDWWIGYDAYADGRTGVPSGVNRKRSTHSPYPSTEPVQKTAADSPISTLRVSRRIGNRSPSTSRLTCACSMPSLTRWARP